MNEEKVDLLAMTGNFLVDAALLTVRVLASKPLDDDFLFEDFKSFLITESSSSYGISWLTSNLRRFKSYTMFLEQIAL